MGRRTREQLIAYHEEQAKKLKAAASKAARNARTKRLCTCAGIIEKYAGMELDEKYAFYIGCLIGTRRRNDPELRAKVDEFWAQNHPDGDGR